VFTQHASIQVLNPGVFIWVIEDVFYKAAKGIRGTFSNAGFCLALSAAGQEKMIASSNKRNKQLQRC
jgi:hypothetical protein